MEEQGQKERGAVGAGKVVYQTNEGCKEGPIPKRKT